MSRYAIWNKKDPIITPIGEVFTADQWIAKYPVAGIDTITVVCGGGEINGSFFGTLGQMVESAAIDGCDFSSCATAEDKIATIEAFENAKNAEILAAAKAKAEADAYIAEQTAASLASIAASMEYQNMLTLEDAEA